MSGKMSISKMSIPSIKEAQAEFCSMLKAIISDEFAGESKRLAKATNFAPATLSKVLSNRRAPTAKLVGGIAKVLKSQSRGDELIAAYAVLTAAEARHFRNLVESASGEEFTKAALYPDKSKAGKS